MEFNKPSRTVLAFLLAFAGVVFFSSKAVLVKIAYSYNVDALSLLVLRLIFALPFYIGVFIGSVNKGQLRKFKLTDYSKVVFLGFIGYYMASYLDFSGLNFITASLERLILFVYPTLVLIISAFFLRKKATTEQKIAIAVTYFGVIMAFYQNNNTSGSNILLGSTLIFGSALLYAIYLVGSENLLPRFGVKLFTSIAMTVSTISAMIHFLSVSNVDLLGYSKEVYVTALAMAIFCTVIPSFLIAGAIKLIGASNVAVIGSFGPISTIILAAIFLGEKISVFQMLGTIIVISGVMLLVTGRKAEAKKQTINKKEVH